MIRRSEARSVFGADVAGYEVGRPDYPAQVYDLLRERCGLRPGCRVLEIGPGTGMATRRLLGEGARVLAVEPDAAMAAHLARRLPEVEVVEAGFEEAPLPVSAFDLVVAAMSFHWVDRVTGFTKLGHVIRPGGWGALWWTLWGDPNHPDEFGVAAQRLHGRTRSEPNEPGRPQYELDVDGRLADLRTLAGLVDVGHQSTSWTIGMDAAQVRSHYASMIAIRRRPPAEREPLLDALAGLVEVRFGGLVERRFLTVAYTGRRPAG